MRLETLLPLGKVDPGLRAPEAPLDLGSVAANAAFLEEIGYGGLAVEESPLIGPDTTLRDVAFEVGTALDAAGVHAVLCGGSAATFYAPNVYQSEDLDFVLAFATDGALV